MSDVWANTTLRLYRGVGSALYPFAGPFLRARARRGKEDRDRRAERYGYAAWERPAGPLVWLHAASVGEALAIMPLIERLDTFSINVVLTTGTVTSAEIASAKLPKGVIHQYVPLDMKRAAGRFLDHWMPDLAIFAESELWPTTMTELQARKIPQVLVNARVSDRSNTRWSKRPRLARAIFSKLSAVFAQSTVDADRFRALGTANVSVMGNLKLDTSPPAYDAAAVAVLKQQIGDRPVWVAVSTHDGEEQTVARVHRALLKHLPDLLTVIVPRHPDRGDALSSMLAAENLSCARRSKDEEIVPDTAILLGDTIGEMGLYLALARVAFMGKSLSETGGQGGQNPIEPVMAGLAVLSGRYVQNFRDTYQALVDAGGVKLVRDEAMLASHVAYLLQHDEVVQTMQQSGQKAVTSLAGALDKCVAGLDPYITPLRLRAGLDRRAEMAAKALAEKQLLDQQK
ncbi:3-deoxy-D-manno-octulosonic acid transferase [Ahrensia sp. R2A130]|uniref:3-deoxy-D-manno-octulosonic acid transferase n=1 Tax=Ahrensia sp. R2A130 TaxID=744979 RepID=UPI0001E09C52|nr:3-deoxy-D-manno-octulosonic acid transferase [Ahrensia sp. R2A130]EFL88573.1 3-deoxy-D-manno-octulosonic-acid transferase [Ahrensia sp. R2A130]